jgi:hypothetical protein
LTKISWQRSLVEVAKLHGWICYHGPDNCHFSEEEFPNFPDLVLLRTYGANEQNEECTRSSRIIVAKLKTRKSKIREKEKMWLEKLSKVSGIEVYIWCPEDIVMVEKILSGVS